MTGPETLRVLVVDDEPMARQRVRRLLGEEEQVEVVGEATDGEEAVELIVRTEPHVVFLDIRMPGLDGFDVIEAVGADRMPLVIFVTAYDAHAVQAFEVNAVDYLLKPFDPERLHAAFARARARLAEETAAERGRRVSTVLRYLEERVLEASPQEQPSDRLVIKSRGKIEFVRVPEIDWAETAGNYVRLHVGDRSHLLRETLSALAERLDPTVFLRIHRSYLVNLNRVAQMRHSSYGEYTVELHDGTELRMSRTYRDRILERLSGE